MHQVKLIRQQQSSPPPVIEFYTLPIRGAKDYQCQPPRAISFEQAERISQDLDAGRETGQIDDWQWLAGEFPVCPFCDRPVEEGMPLCRPCESILAAGRKQPADKHRLDR
jgi:hypothetical protein